MDRETRDKWVAALRSGDYEQDTQTGNLKSGPKKCCALGVLMDMEDRFTDENPYGEGYRSKLGNWAWPHRTELSEWALSEDEADRIAHMNDNNKLSFEEIADWIEENL